MREIETPDLRRQVALLEREVADLRRINMQPPIFLRDLKDVVVQHNLECLPTTPEEEEKVALLYDRGTGEWEASSLDAAIDEQVADTFFDTDAVATVVEETEFGLLSDAGFGNTAAKDNHTHGTPLPRHPQVGWPYVDFSSGHVAIGVRENELYPGAFGGQDHGTFLRSFITSPTGANGWGRATIDLRGNNDGSASLFIYNDLDINGSYESGTVGKPFSVELQGMLEIQSIGNTPSISNGANARLFFNASTGRLQLSEGGGQYRNIGGSDVDLGNTVISERAFSNAAASAGNATTVSRSNHTHGTPAPLHPQSGFPYVDFGTTQGLLALGRLSGEFGPALIGTEDTGSFERLFITSPMRSGSSGRATISIVGKTDGNAIVGFYNDLDINNAIGETGAAAKPFGIELTGDLTFFAINNTPPVAPTGQAKLYYVSGKLKLSENGGAYRDIGGDVGVGAAGAFLVTNTAGTGTTWAAVSEIYFDDVNNRIGIGASSPQERLAVRDGAAGLISTFFGPIGNNYIGIGNDKTLDNSLQIGYDDGSNYGWLSVTGAASATLIIDNTGNVGVGVTDPGYKLIVSGVMGIRSSTGEFSPAFFGTEELASSSRSYLTSPTKTSGWGRATLDFVGNNDGSAKAFFYNDLDTDGNYGPGTVGKPFTLQLQGIMEFTGIADTPSVAPAGTGARMYYKSSTGKLQLSENGGAYRDIGGDVGVGATGTFLVTNTTANGTRWTGSTEIVVSSSGRFGIGIAAPSTRFHLATEHSAASQFRMTLPASANGAGTGEASLQLWVSEPGQTWTYAGIGYNTNNDGGANGFGRLNSNFGQAWIRFVESGALWFSTTSYAGTHYSNTLSVSGGFVTTAGRLGVGTANPLNQFQVNVGANQNLGIRSTAGETSIGAFNDAGSAAVPLQFSASEFNFLDGFVGIGTTVPQEQLSVRIPSNGLVSTFFGPIGNNYIAVGNDKTTNNSVQIGYVDTGDYGYVAVTGISPTAQLTLHNSGKVGIGNSFPLETLHVSGTLLVDNGIRCSDFEINRASGVGVLFTTFSDGNPVLIFEGTTDAFAPGYRGGVGASGVTTVIWGGVATNSYARPWLSLSRHSTEANRAVLQFHNDLKTNGTYGSGGNAASGAQVIFTGGILDSLGYNVTNLWLSSDSPRTGLSMQHNGTAYVLGVYSGAGFEGFLCRNSNDSAYVPIRASAFVVNSAREAKSDIRALSLTAARDSILALKPCTFSRPGEIYLDGRPQSAPTTHGGFVADEVAQCIPEAVSWGNGKPEGLDYAPIVARSVVLIQEHDSEIENLKKENEALKKRVSILEGLAA